MSWAGVASLAGGCREKMVSCSFLCLGFVVSQSVMPVEQFLCFTGQNALSCGDDVRVHMCGCKSVVLMMIIIMIIMTLAFLSESPSY